MDFRSQMVSRLARNLPKEHGASPEEIKANIAENVLPTLKSFFSNNYKSTLLNQTVYIL